MWFCLKFDSPIKNLKENSEGKDANHVNLLFVVNLDYKFCVANHFKMQTIKPGKKINFQNDVIFKNLSISEINCSLFIFFFNIQFFEGKFIKIYFKKMNILIILTKIVFVGFCKIDSKL